MENIHDNISDHKVFNNQLNQLSDGPFSDQNFLKGNALNDSNDSLGKMITKGGFTLNKQSVNSSQSGSSSSQDCDECSDS